MGSISIRGLGKRFGGVQVLEGVDLDVADAELFALLGPSGCGKSTLIRILAGLEVPDEGTVTIGGKVVSGQGVQVPPEGRGLGMVFQSYAVWPHKTVLANVAYPLEVRGVSKQEAREKARRALSLVRLDGLEGRWPHELSGGQQQRVALARALVGEPEVLLLDEPLSNLDARLRDEMRAEIAELRARLQVTIVMVTHDQSEALGTADRVAVMRKGRIVQSAPPAELYEAPRDLYVAETLGAINALEVARIEGARVEAACGIAAEVEGPAPPGDVALCVRPEQIRLVSEGGTAARVTRRAFLGARVELQLSVGAATLRALVPSHEAPRVGDEVHIALERPRLLPR